MLNLQSIYFGQKHKDFDFRDYDVIRKVQRLYCKHHRQAENDCNGKGYIKSEFYRCDNDNAYIGEDTVFYVEMNRIEERINKIVFQFNHDKYALWRVKPFRVEFQGDPRGYTVKLYYNDELIQL